MRRSTACLRSLSVVALAILMGVLPNLFLRPIEPSVERMLNHYHQAVATRVQANRERPASDAPLARRRQP